MNLKPFKLFSQFSELQTVEHISLRTIDDYLGNPGGVRVERHLTCNLKGSQPRALLSVELLPASPLWGQWS
jgi:hypothetical protein